MKKAIFLSVFATMMALFSGAQNAPILFPGEVDTLNDVTTTAIATNALVQNPGAYNFYSALEYTKHDSANWAYGNITLRNGLSGSFTDMANGLQSNTLYDVRHKTWNIAMTDSATTPIQTVKTKVGPQPLSITFVDTLATLPNSGLIFSASAIGHLHPFAFGLNAITLAAETDTLWNITGPTDTVHFLTDGPGTTHPRVKMILRGDSGTITMASIASPIFKTPVNTGGTLMLDTIIKEVNSLSTFVNITSIGNQGNSVLITEVKDSITGALVNTPINQIINAPGIFQTQINPLHSNHPYIIIQRLLNGQNQGDTIVNSTRTKKVPGPVINAIGDTVEQVNAYKFYAYGNSNGSYDSSNVVKWRVYEGLNLVLIDTQNANFIGTGSAIFNELNKSAGQNYIVNIQAENAAGVKSNMITLTLHTKLENQNPDPTVDDLLTNGSSALDITNMHFYVLPGNTADYAYVLRDITDNILVDTTIVAHGATTNLTFALQTANNLLGGHAYSVTPITIGASTISQGNTLVQVLPSPGAPIAAGIGQDSANINSVFATLFGDGAGNACTVRAHLELNNVTVLNSTKTMPGYYSGSFAIPVFWTGLQSDKEYMAVLEVIAPNGGPVGTTYGVLRTTVGTTTGIIEVTADKAIKTTDPVADNQQVRMLTLLGQTLTEGNYQNTRQQMSGKGSVIMQILDQNGNAKPLEDEKGRTVYGMLKSFQ